jgi:hypothetical protein
MWTVVTTKRYREAAAAARDREREWLETKRRRVRADCGGNEGGRGEYLTI